MIHNTIELDLPYEKLGIKHVGDKPTVTTYIKEMYPDMQDAFNRPLVIICPGGGFGHLSPREGEAVAIKMLEMGYNAVILRYSLTPNVYPCQLFELAYTVDYVKKYSKEWDVDSDKIIVAGFSAGGYVAASFGNLWNSPDLNPVAKQLGYDDEDRMNLKVAGMLLCYPVITGLEFAHRGSFDNLLGENKSADDNQYNEQLKALSLEFKANADTPRTFMWHTFEDNSVPLENSLLFAKALRKAGVPFEYHVFEKGIHGLGLGTKETATKNLGHFQPEVFEWTKLFEAWMEKI